MEFFNLKGLHNLIDLNGRQPIFKSKFTNCGFSQKLQNSLIQLTKELQKRNFDVPGFEIEFSFDVDDAEIKIFTIYNKAIDLRIVSDWEIFIPRMVMNIHNDNSGGLDVYAGTDWKKDKEDFIEGPRFHRKMNNQSRIHLHYNLNGDTFNYQGDSRDYDREDTEAKFYFRPGIEGQFVDYINNIISDIKKLPVLEIINMFVQPEPVTLSNSLFDNKKLIGFMDLYGDDSKGILPGVRLLDLGMKLPKDHPFHEQMHDGFIYMEIIDNTDQIPDKPVVTRPNFNYGSKRGPYLILPKNVNNFFVVDASIYDKLKSDWFAKNENATKLTDDLYNEFRIEQAKTMVPINQYKGGFEKPIVITNRRLWPDEVSELSESKSLLSKILQS